MLAYDSLFTFEEEVNAAIVLIPYYANQVSKQMNSWFRAVKKLL